MTVILCSLIVIVPVMVIGLVAARRENQYKKIS
jgi:hypothetical protein